MLPTLLFSFFTPLTAAQHPCPHVPCSLVFTACATSAAPPQGPVRQPHLRNIGISLCPLKKREAGVAGSYLASVMNQCTPSIVGPPVARVAPSTVPLSGL